MSRVGETVLYGTDGVCKIAEICKMKVGGKREEYYVLKPIHREGATVFVPLGNEALLSKMRPVLSQEEITALLDVVTKEDCIWIEDHTERKTEFQRILVGGDRKELLSMIRAIYLHRQELQSKNKRLRTADEQMLRDAEKLLNDEFALVLNIPQHQVPEYIRIHVEGEQ